MNALSTGMALGLGRLKARFTATLLATSTFFVVLAATVERHATPLRAADNTLIGAVFGIALPLCTYAIMAQTTDRGRLDAATNTTARFGSNRRLVALGIVLMSALAAMMVAAVLAVIGVFVSRGTHAPQALSDGMASARIAAAGGAAYVGLFSLGSMLGRSGGGRFIALAIDWILGSGTGWASAPLPRGHLANLLGAAPVLDLTQPAAYALVLGLSILYVGAALWRTAP